MRLRQGDGCHAGRELRPGSQHQRAERGTGRSIAGEDAGPQRSAAARAGCHGGTLGWGRKEERVPWREAGGRPALGT
jgi:hypothetical protein